MQPTFGLTVQDVLGVCHNIYFSRVPVPIYLIGRPQPVALISGFPVLMMTRMYTMTGLFGCLCISISLDICM